MDSSPRSDPAVEIRIHQQETIADLGQQALATDDLDQLMRDATDAVAETLDSEFANVLQLLPGSDEVFLRHGVGWRNDRVGSASIRTDQDSQVGYTLRTDEPVIVEDIRTDGRFSGPELLTSHDVVSGVSAIIGSVEKPWGVLGTYAAEQREFTEHDAAFVQSVANVLASAIENKRTQHELEDIYGRISDAFFALDEEWRFSFLNEQAHEVINPDGRKLQGKNIWDEFPAATERRFKPKYEQAMYDQETVSFEEYYPEPLDAWFEVRAYPSETGLSVYFRDITERKVRERRHRESEQRYRALSEHFPNGLVTLYDDDLRYQLAAGRAFDYLPISPEDAENRTVREAWGDDAADVLEPAFEAALDGEEQAVELDYIGREWVVHAVPVTDDRGEVVAGMTMTQDITERKEREAELERTLDLLEKTERIADVGGWEVDPETKEPYWSDHLFDILDVEYDEQPTLDEALDIYHSEADREIVENAVDEALSTGEAFDVEVRFPRPDGDVGWLRLQGKPEVKAGTVVSFRGAAQDITERKEREQRLETAIEQLEASNERLEQFAYAASHDLQEPLRMVSSYLQLLESRYVDELDADAAEFIEYAVDGADRMRRMIEGLLEYSRVETQGEPFNPVELDAVIDDVREDLHVKIAESGADLEITNLPCVEGDPDQLRQVFQNLLDNAIEYSGDEPPQIRVTAERDGTEWTISVADEGVGFDPDYADQIFRVFERLHTSDEHPGTGIGLALCERIVERHGGEICVDSEPGEGTTFSFSLPATSDREG